MQIIQHRTCGGISARVCKPNGERGCGCRCSMTFITFAVPQQTRGYTGVKPTRNSSQKLEFNILSPPSPNCSNVTGSQTCYGCRVGWQNFQYLMCTGKFLRDSKYCACYFTPGIHFLFWSGLRVKLGCLFMLRSARHFCQLLAQSTKVLNIHLNSVLCLSSAYRREHCQLILFAKLSSFLINVSRVICFRNPFWSYLAENSFVSFGCYRYPGPPKHWHISN